MVKIIIAAGGTGGHLFPGIAIAGEMKRAHPDAEVSFAGTARGFESKILPALGWPMVVVGSSSTGGGTFFATVSKWSKLPLAAMRAIYVFIRSRPDLLVSIGGHGAAPVAIAAWILRIPFVIIEPNAIAGFTNEKLGRMCARAFVQFEETKKYFPNGKAVITGMPVRAEVAAMACLPDRQAGKEKRAVDRLTIFVFGGSQGSVRINRAMLGAMKHMGDILKKIRVIHQTGRNDDVRIYECAYAEAGVDAKVFEFSDRIWECYEVASLVVSRAGGMTVAETSALGIPSIMVPYPHAKGHQMSNALGLARTGGAVVVEDGECTGERLAREIGTLVDHPERLSAMSAALSRFGKPDAAEKIVEEIWKILENHR